MNQVTLDRYVDAVVAPLDGARRAALGAITKSRSLTRVVSHRDARVPFIAAAQIALIFAVTMTRPLWLIVIGPIVLGIPHLMSDVRYLILRQRVAREVLFVSLTASAMLIGLRVLDLFHAAPAHWASLEVGIAIAWMMAAIVSGAHERRSRAPLLLLPALLALGYFAALHAGLVRIVFAHVHNVVGVVAWIILFRKNKRAVMLPAIAMAAAVTLLISGVAQPFTQNAFSGFGFDLFSVGHWLAPGASPNIAESVALSFVFMQSVHYATWLVWIPQDSLPGEGTFTFRMTARSLVSDFGIVALGIFALLAVALAGSALFHARSAVGAYMSLAAFHGYFEIAILAYFAARGRDHAKSAT